MLRSPWASALATTFLLSFSLYSTQAQNFKAPSERTEPLEPIQEIVYAPQPIPGGDQTQFEWDNQDQIKMPVGFERWTPGPIPNPESIVTEGAGWFYCNNLSPIDINVTYPNMGFRAIDIEVEQWNPPVFSAVFVQNTGIYEVDDSFVMVAHEDDIRDWLFNGEWIGWRIVDLEVADDKGHFDEEAEIHEIGFLSKIIAVLIVPNEGNQYTPEWDFVVHATPLELNAFTASFTGNVRTIDNEISFNDYDNYLHTADHHENIVFSQIMVSDEGIEHVETAIFQFTTPLNLWALEQEGWQLIDSEKNIPLTYEDFPEVYGEYTGVFVQKPNLTEFYDAVNGYSLDPYYSLDDKRMIDLELVPDGGSFLLDEVYLLYD